MIRPSSTLWRVLAMAFGIVVSTVLLMWVLSSWVLSRSLGSISRAVIEDDLGEYAVLYNKKGTEAIRRLYEAGAHQHDHMLRLIDHTGHVLIDARSPEIEERDVPVLLPPAAHEIAWISTPLHEKGATLLLGGRSLGDGEQLWFGRTDVEDRSILDSVRQQLLLAAGFALLIALLPVLWFMRRVLLPVRGFISTARALTDADRLDDRLPVGDGIPELSEFAESLNRSLDRVAMLTEELEAANDQLAHELRTPLARIRGNVEAVLAHYGEPEGREAAVLSVEEIERSAALIQTILSVRAGDTRSMRLHLETLSMKTLLTDICELYTAAAEERGLELELLVTGDATVLVDRQRLQQAVSNLLDNALSYTPAGGTITVLLDVERDYVTLHVQDTGPGITDTDKQKIWRRFMRGSAASARAPGIGLGLSLVRAVATIHRGEAGVENRTDRKGADFWIKLPTSLDIHSQLKHVSH